MAKIIIILSFICILFTGSAYGEDTSQNDGDVIIPPGMEVLREGSVNVVVPRGARLRKQGSVMLIETADEYASRKFMDTEEHFKTIEKELNRQDKEIEDLKEAVKKLEEDARKK